MSTTLKYTLREVMQQARDFVKKNGYSMSEALKVAWLNVKLKAQLKKRIVKFYFQKVDGTLRETFGTLKERVVPQTQGIRKMNDTCEVYFDTEKSEWRCFKRANLIKIA